jgi:hypothetical protein
MTNKILAILWLWLVISGGLNGILLGAIIVNYIWPGHPVYIAIQDFLRSFLT